MDPNDKLGRLLYASIQQPWAELPLTKLLKKGRNPHFIEVVLTLRGDVLRA